MNKGKSFLNFYSNIQTHPIQVNQKPRSLSSKNFIALTRINNPQKQFIGESFQIERLDRKNYNRSSNHISGQNSFSNHRVRSGSQNSSNFMQPKKFYRQGIKSHFRPKTNFNRSKSANQVYKHFRIEILQQMNNQLDEFLRKRNEQQQMKKKKQKQQFKTQIIAKLDKLENYLIKIKSQRQKQHNPKKKQSPVILHQQLQNDVKNQQQSTGVTEYSENNLPFKNQYLDALSQLDKIKQQLVKVREIAVNVKQRNSLSKNKKENIQEIQQNKNINFKYPIEMQSRFNYEHNKTHVHMNNDQNHQIKVSHGRFSNPTFEMKHEDQNFITHKQPIQIRTNNHINQSQNNFLTQNQIIFSNHTQIQPSNFQRPTSKPKITFTFSKKN